MGYRYIGSKARVVEEIIRYLGAPLIDGCFIDAFSGTGIVASCAADIGWNIQVNDMMHCAAVMSEAQLVSDKDVPFTHFGGYNRALAELGQAEKEGVIWREYSPASYDITGIERKYFTEENAKKIDGIVAKIQEWRRNGEINQAEFALLTATLIVASNNIANIAGTYGCFLSKWQPQALGVLTLRPLEVRKKSVQYTVSTCDVFDLCSKPEDTVYLDPPYTKRQYASYYHILETITLGDEPVVSGVAGLRPWKDRASVFCYKQKACKALAELVAEQRAHRVLISYSNDGHVRLEELINQLEMTGTVSLLELASIGRYRPNVVASTRKPEVKEYLIDYKRRGG